MPEPLPALTRDEHITTLHSEGKGQREIGRRVGISQPAVRKRLIRLGLLPPTGGGDNPGQSDNPPAAPQAAHFRAACRTFPDFSFNVPALRSLRQERGDEFPSGVVHFHHGVLDTSAQDFTEIEAAVILTRLKALRDRPAWGIHIVLLPEDTAVDAHDNRGTTGC